MVRQYNEKMMRVNNPQLELLISLRKLTQQNIPKSLRNAAERQITRIELGVFDQ